ncbi:beta-eliminating lyase-related protein [Staphylococcus gallinarum]|uniref:beta-eliminating lyase-related protein n=1 Tax=Staphylococcus gallinarum TaxID=1293 RepID=UPI0030C5E117
MFHTKHYDLDSLYKLIDSCNEISELPNLHSIILKAINSSKTSDVTERINFLLITNSTRKIIAYAKLVIFSSKKIVLAQIFFEENNNDFELANYLIDKILTEFNKESCLKLYVKVNVAESFTHDILLLREFKEQNPLNLSYLDNMDSSSKYYVFNPDIQCAYNPYVPMYVREIPEISVIDRYKILNNNNNNIFMIPPEFIKFDFFTDSSRSTISNNQLTSGIMGQHGPIGTGNPLKNLKHTISNIFGFKYTTIFTQGRSAEAAFNSLIINKNKEKLVLENNVFSTMKYHQGLNDFEIIDISNAMCFDFSSNDVFKGNIDLEKLKKYVTNRDPSYVAIELCCNDVGGYAISLSNLFSVREILKSENIKLVIDGTRIIENAYIIKKHEKKNSSIKSIIKQICSTSDYLIMSMKKDFLCDYGGLVACNSKKDNFKFLDYSIAYGEELSGRDLAYIDEGINEVVNNDFYIEYRNYLSYVMYENLLKEGLPVITPNSPYAVFLDVTQLCGDNGVELHDIQIKLYLETGIRVGSHSIDDYKLIRIAIPHRLYDLSHINYCSYQIVKSLKNSTFYPKYKKLECGNTITEHTYSKYEKVGKVND